jgi:hypothetical protein
VPKHSIAKAHRSWLQALEEMRAALTANPLVADPFMASAQVFEDIGRVMFGNHTAPKKPRRKRAKAKRAGAKKKAPARRRTRKS